MLTAEQKNLGALICAIDKVYFYKNVYFSCIEEGMSCNCPQSSFMISWYTKPRRHLKCVLWHSALHPVLLCISMNSLDDEQDGILQKFAGNKDIPVDKFRDQKAWKKKARNEPNSISTYTPETLNLGRMNQRHRHK